MCIYACMYVSMHVIHTIHKDFPKERYNTYGKRVIRICIQNTLVPPIAGYF